VLQRWLFHIACVVALAWPAMVNRQPFYFPDTTAYVRSADSAAYIFSGHRVTTDWTAHYSRQLAMRGKIKDVDHKVSATVTDLGTDSIMAGRSPYFGALLWLAYVIGHFWTFVLAQAVISYALIRLTLRLFDLSRPAIVAAAVAMLSLATALPFFVGLLMPDRAMGALRAAAGLAGLAPHPYLHPRDDGGAAGDLGAGAPLAAGALCAAAGDEPGDPRRRRRLGEDHQHRRRADLR
jgi:hypothetical protein